MNEVARMAGLGAADFSARLPFEIRICRVRFEMAPQIGRQELLTHAFLGAARHRYHFTTFRDECAREMVFQFTPHEWREGTTDDTGGHGCSEAERPDDEEDGVAVMLPERRAGLAVGLKG